MDQGLDAAFSLHPQQPDRGDGSWLIVSVADLLRRLCIDFKRGGDCRWLVVSQVVNDSEGLPELVHRDWPVLWALKLWIRHFTITF